MSNILETKIDENVIVHVNDGGTIRKHSQFDTKGGLILGSDVDDAKNVRIKRAGDKTIQFVGGDDVTADGSPSPDVAFVLGSVPVGAIIAWNPGYYTNGANGSYTDILGSSIGAANSYLNTKGWYVADGAVPSVAGSLIWNVGGRNLPNLTDGRFLMGATAPGTAAGSNNMLDHYHNHTHPIDHDHANFVTAVESPHGHTISHLGTSLVGDGGTSSVEIAAGLGPDSLANFTNFNVSGGSHSHNINVPNFSGTSGVTSGSGTAPTATENRPQYLSTFYIVRVV